VVLNYYYSLVNPEKCFPILLLHKKKESKDFLVLKYLLGP